MALWIALYFVAAVFSYSMLYAAKLDENNRLTTPYDHTKSRWGNFWDHLPEVFRFMAHDFFRIHCPWDKYVSTKYRVQEVRSMLYLQSYVRSWRRSDIRNSSKHEAIAYECFPLRSTFWLTNILKFATSPIVIGFSVVISAIASAYVVAYETWTGTSVVRRK
jgi:hypothetical protein